MTGLVRKATLLSAGGLLIAGAAMAGIPNASNCTMGSTAVDGARVTVFDGALNLQANLPGQLLTVRDTDNNPVPFVSVTLLPTTDPFVNDGVGINVVCNDADIQFCDTQDPAWTGGAVTTGADESVNATTNGSGQLFVTLFGAGPNFNCGLGTPNTTCASDDPAAPSRPKCVNVIAGGTVLLGRVIVTNSRYDLNGNNEVEPTDGSQWLSVRAAYSTGATQPTTPPWTGGYNSSGDYDSDGDVDPFDVAIISAAIIAIGAPAACVVIP